MQLGVTGNSLAMSISDLPILISLRMFLTSTRVRIARWLFSPRLSVPWISLSAEFSFGVAHRRWEAFMQSKWPFPQEWAEWCRRLGGSPWASSQIYRLAKRVFPSTLTFTRGCFGFGFLGNGQKRHAKSLHSTAIFMNFLTSSDFVSCSGSPCAEARA